MSSIQDNPHYQSAEPDQEDEDVTTVPEDAFPLDQLMELTLAPLRVAESHPGDDRSGEDDDEVASSLKDIDGLYPWERTRIPEKSFNDLQWDQLVDHLADGAVSPEGYLLAKSIGPLPEKGAVRRRMREVAECQDLLRDDDTPPLRGLSDIRKAVAYAERGGSLIAEDLWAIARNCDVASRAARYFQQRSSTHPYLSEVAYALDACDDLREALNHAVEPGGRLADHASPDLGRLRRAVQNQHDRIRTKVDQLLKNGSMEVHLQDDYFTMREDRYVLPVRAGAKGTVGGIVHGYSSSGQTAYIEPDELINLNNKLRWAQIELKEEEERILKRLSNMVARFGETLLQSMDILAYLDLVLAGAKLGNRLQSTVPELTDGELSLKRARHPLLWIKFARTINGEEVNETVPNDVRLDPEKNVLVVSGPNTGGKTVLLKTLGLCALMARCGLTIPADAGSQLPLFRTIYTDIGDEQSIERDLSTFSGHLTNINTFIDDTDPTSLVLLDELFTGTDPMQGAALAVALLEELTERGATTVVTTHLESLKTLAFQKESYANASMGFDLDTLAPTYRVIYGLPGSSYAVRIAQRLGFPERIIERAHHVLEGEDHQSVEEILTSLEDKRSEMESEQRRLEHSRLEAERNKRKYKDKYDKLLQREKEMVHEQTKKLKEELDAARDLIREQIAGLQRKGDLQTREYNQKELEQMREGLGDVEGAVERASDYTKPPETGPDGLVRIQPEDLEEGMEVHAHTFKRKGTIMEYDAGDDTAQVQLGAMKVKVDIEDLYYPNESSRRAHSSGKRRHTQPSSSRGGQQQGRGDKDQPLLPQMDENTVDLRGMRVDESLEKVELFLDSVYAANLSSAYIIHGHGTGALKRAVRGYLPTSPYVDRFRRGERGEGGDGVTVVFMGES